MKNFFRTFLFSMTGILVLIVAVGYFLPSQYKVEKSSVMSVPAEKIFPHVVNLESWKAWSPWQKKDPKSQMSFGNNLSNMQYMEWNGEKIGMGRLDIEKVEPNKMIQTSLRFYTPNESQSSGMWTFAPEGSGTKVTWSNEGQLDGLIEKWFGLFMNAAIGKDFEAGLASLKAIAENQ